MPLVRPRAGVPDGAQGVRQGWAVTLPVWLVWMIRGGTLRPTRTFTPCSRGGSGAANTRRGPGCLRKQNWRTNSAAGPTSRPGRSGHSNATGWPGGFSEEGTYRPDRMLIQASHDAPSRLRPQDTSAPPPFASPAAVLAGRPGSSAGRRFRGRPLSSRCEGGSIQPRSPATPSACAAAPGVTGGRARARGCRCPGGCGWQPGNDCGGSRSPHQGSAAR